MLAPDICYQFTRPQDAVSPHFEFWRRSGFGTVPVGQQFGQVDFGRIPSDRALVLGTAIGATANGAVNEFPVSILVLASPNAVPSFNADMVACGSQAVSAGPSGVYRYVGWQGQVIIPGGNYVALCIVMQTNSSAGHNVYVSATGISMPRGNLVEG